MHWNLANRTKIEQKGQAVNLSHQVAISLVQPLIDKVSFWSITIPCLTTLIFNGLSRNGLKNPTDKWLDGLSMILGKRRSTKMAIFVAPLVYQNTSQQILTTKSQTPNYLPQSTATPVIKPNSIHAQKSKKSICEGVNMIKQKSPHSKRFTLEMYTSVKYLRAYKLLWNASILGMGVNRERRVICGNTKPCWKDCSLLRHNCR